MRYSLYPGVISEGGKATFIADYPFLTDLNDNASANFGTLTRASGKTQDSETSVADLGNNVAAFDALGVIIEPQHTNLLRQSRDITTTWSSARATLNGNTGDTVDPKGTNTADKITKNVSSPTNSPVVFQSVSVGASDYTYSWYVKKGNVDYCHLWVQDSATGANYANAVFNLTSATKVSHTTGGSGYTALNYGIELRPNGWYRIWQTFNLASAKTINCNIYLADNTGVPQTASLNDYMYVWQADLQTGAFLRSPVTTTTTSAACLADALTIPTTGFPVNDFIIEVDYTSIEGSTGVFPVYDGRTATFSGIVTYQSTNTSVSQKGNLFQASFSNTLVAGVTDKWTTTNSTSTGITIDVDGTSGNNANTNDLLSINANARLGILFDDTGVRACRIKNFKVYNA